MSHLAVARGFMDRVCFVYEVIAIREGWLMFGNHDFSRGEMDEIISFIVKWLAESVLIAFIVLCFLSFIFLFL